MSWVGRTYLALVAFRSFGVTFGLSTGGNRHETNPAFVVVESMAPLGWWAAAFAVVGVAAVGGVIFPNRPRFLSFLVASSVLTATFAVGFALSLTGTSGATTYMFAAAVDFLVLMIPTLSPSTRT